MKYFFEWVYEGGYIELFRQNPAYADLYRAWYIEPAAASLVGVFSFGGTTLLIVVGVAIETYRELEAQLTMRNYKGFLN